MDWRILVNFFRQSMLNLPTHYGFHDLFLKHPMVLLDITHSESGEATSRPYFYMCILGIPLMEY
jgi:hypothetical protein